MPDSQYTFDRRGYEMRVTDATDHTITLTARQDGLGVNVKDDTLFRQYPLDVQKASERLGETRTESVYNGMLADFWTWAEECGKRYGFDEVYQDGRSGGWLVLPDTRHLGAEELIDPEPEQEDLRDRVLACMFEIERSIEEDWRQRFYEALKEEARFAGKCPNCGADIDLRKPGHETGCVFGALLTIAQDRGEIKLADYAVEDFDIDAFWNRLGRVVDDLERQLRELHPREKEAAKLEDVEPERSRP